MSDNAIAAIAHAIIKAKGAMPRDAFRSMLRGIGDRVAQRDARDVHYLVRGVLYPDARARFGVILDVDLLLLQSDATPA
jgi:hypothetical protein